ncbi:hypothetical protein [Pseudomonas extremorientalis]|uniref:Uncharacterized protein n=1 Tax=Pseudomonas extremorientalis TaxID=169669 RepID=A0ABY0SAZ0_9PSED|nr:hypothetical protein [Pseudomonas extremorientalis]SDP01212.1 hypothetical protein SAMN04490184_2042 [Pseudomonas extremorientalis]
MGQILAILKEVPSRCVNSGLAITRRSLERHVMQLYQNISNALKGQDKSELEGKGSASTEAEDSSVLHLPLFTDNQRNLVVELILAERRHATRWWTHLSELRRRKELPEWVAADIGTHDEHDLMLDSRKVVNQALFGSDDLGGDQQYRAVVLE